MALEVIKLLPYQLPDGLREVRRARELTQTELAGLVQMSHSTISDFEHGRRTPSVRTLLRLADALGVTPNDLLLIQ